MFEIRQIPSGHLLGDNGYAVKPYLPTPLQNPITRPQQRYNIAQINKNYIKINLKSIKKPIKFNKKYLKFNLKFNKNYFKINFKLLKNYLKINLKLIKK